ncbi:hypothetical protein SAY87_021344 [Trapa incisa]|uniref:Uncharacterized protein n=1 Tax=Trapa incisa TaxID=236973 RepID=A0AAN7JRY8_9MYRT|nr:hypothetical protein SAY87_021344 [Trapa incisa]
MFSSNPNPNDPNTLSSLPFLGDLIATNSKQDHDHHLPFSLLNFPASPFSLYTEEDSAIFLQSCADYTLLPDAEIDDVLEPGKQFLMSKSEWTDDSKRGHEHGAGVTKKLAPRKRSSKKDRHSKINTAQGPRDRRMRLSLEVSRKFFDLQDMLRFDKASKTVDWLLTQSKSAIAKLSNDAIGNSSSIAGEKADVSGVIDESVDALSDEDQAEKLEEDSKRCCLSELHSRKARNSCLSKTLSRRISSAQLARESREKRRTRAKERTRAKMLFRRLNNRSDHPFDVGGESRNCPLEHGYMKISSMEVEAHAQVAKLKRLGASAEQIMECSSATTNNYYLQSNGNGIHQQHQFRDFQLFLKPWEGYGGSR